MLLGVALFLLAQAPPAPADAAASAARALDVSAIVFAVQNPRIVLGDTATVDITIVAKRADGGPLDVARPELRVSTGKVTVPRRTGAGTWVTTFTPPAEQFPHVAILFATIETSTVTAVGFTPLRLWGKGQTTVRTKPKSKVTVFIGNESFGPVAAEANGAAKVDIVVPPGPENAVARSVDEVGNQSQKTIDLGVPTFNRLAAMALDDTVAPEGSARVLAFVVDKKGEPLFDAKLASRASSGTVGDMEGLAPGMFRLLVRPAASAKGKVNVDVTLEGAASSKARAVLDVIAGKPARALLQADRTSLSADDTRAVTVVVKLLDAGGNPIPPRAASVDVDLGRVDDVQDAAGARTVTWVLPAALVRPLATLTVRTPTGEVLGTQDVALFAGRPASASFDKVESVVADGAASVEVRLRVMDAAGNGLVPTGTALAVDPSIGRFVAGTVDGKVYRARFVPEPRDHDDIATLQGTVAGLATETKVRLVPRPRARLLVGPGVLVGTNYGALVQSGPDLSLLVRLPGFDGGVHAGINVSLLQSVSAPAGVDHRAFPVVVEAAWRPLLTPDLTAHVGAAAGFVLTDELVGAGAAATRTVSPGGLAQVVAGAGYRLGPGFAELDLRVGYGDTSPSSSTVGLPLGAAVVAGYRFGI